MSRLRTLGLSVFFVIYGGAFVGKTYGNETVKKPKTFPQRPITMMVPYGARGGSDELSRAMAAAVEKVIGVDIHVVNWPGEGGRAVIPVFMIAPHDGYTVMEHIDDAASLYASGKIKANPVTDWTPLIVAQVTFSQLYVRPADDRFRDWNSFLRNAKANNGKITIANVGNVGSMERVNMLLLEKELSFKTQQISIETPLERYLALVRGRVDALFEQPGDVRSFLKAGKMAPILTFLSERPAAFAGVPSLKDVGAKFEALLRFRSFFTHGDVPEDRLKYLEWAFTQGFQSAKFQDFNQRNYMHLIDSYRDAAGARKLFRNAIALYREVYKEIGLIK